MNLTQEQLEALKFVFESAEEYLETLEGNHESEKKLAIVEELIKENES